MPLEAVSGLKRKKRRHGYGIDHGAAPRPKKPSKKRLPWERDKAVLLTDRAFAGSDTLITAFTLSRAIMKMKKYDLILCGRQAIDGDTAQVGPQISNFLGLPLVT